VRCGWGVGGVYVGCGWVCVGCGVWKDRSSMKIRNSNCVLCQYPTFLLCSNPLFSGVATF
jgi:hypothetical protein